MKNMNMLCNMLLIVTILNSVRLDAAANTVGSGGELKNQQNIETNTEVFTCAQGSVCNIQFGGRPAGGKSVNAVGDLVTIKLTATPIKLGSITKDRELHILLPAIGEQKVFELSLTQAFNNPQSRKSDKRNAKLVGQNMQIACITRTATDGERASGTAYVMTMYRRMQNNGVWEIVWQERGSLSIKNTTALPEDISITVTVTPDGQIQFVENGKEEALYLGEA